MVMTHREQYRGIDILVGQQDGGWQAQAAGIGALSSVRASLREAIGEIHEYLDDQAVAFGGRSDGRV